jgi:hypothetical protein
MAAYKTWSIGDVLTASDLNNSLMDLPLNTAAFSATYSGGAIAPNASQTLVITFPSARFNVAPICTFSTTSPYITPYVSSVGTASVTVGLINNGNSSSAASFTVYGFAVQMTSGTAAG